MIHAYRITAYLNNNVGLSDPNFYDSLNKQINISKKEMRQFGGDPLPDQEVPFVVDRQNKVIVFVFRTEMIPPDDPRLTGIVRRQASELNFTNKVKLEYHLCGNGTRYPCEKWRVIFEQ